MNRTFCLLLAGLVLAAVVAAGQGIEFVPAIAAEGPAEPAGKKSPLTDVIRGVFGLGPAKQQADRQVPRKPVPVSPEMQAEVEEQVRALAHDDFHVREQAALRLIEMGEPALAALQDAGKSSDAEVRFRAQQLHKIVQSRVMFDSRVLAGHADIVWTVAWSHSGKLLASGGGGRHNNGQWSAGDDFAIRLWDPATGKATRRIEGHTATVNRLVWSQSDGYLLSASSDGTARIWRVDNGSEFRIFRGHEGSVSHALLTADEKQVVTAGWDKTIRIWDVKTGKELRKIDWPHGRVWGLDLSPDGSLLAVCGDHPVIRLYHFQDGRAAGELPGHPNNAATLAFSPDGTRLASGGWDNMARVWSVKDRAAICTLSGHSGRVEGLAWSADGQFVVTGCLDSKVRVFNAAQGTLLRVYEGHSQGVAKVAMSPQGDPQGDRIASAGWDGNIRVWPMAGIVVGSALPAAAKRSPLIPPAVEAVPAPR